MHDKHVHEARYVGKAGAEVNDRLRGAFKKREVGEGASVEVTVWEPENRQTKYIEQLLLTSFSFPLNGAENKGRRILRIPVGDREWL